MTNFQEKTVEFSTGGGNWWMYRDFKTDDGRTIQVVYDTVSSDVFCLKLSTDGDYFDCERFEQLDDWSPEDWIETLIDYCPEYSNDNRYQIKEKLWELFGSAHAAEIIKWWIDLA